MQKAQYIGKQHYWNQYEIVPREKYIRGYYGMYGPDTDLSKYRPLQADEVDTVKLERCPYQVSGVYEFFDGCGCGGGGSVITYMFILLVLYYVWARTR